MEAMSTTIKESGIATPASVEAWLTVQNIPESPWACPIKTEPKTIGRGRGCAVRVLHGTVSREHAVVWQEGGRLYIRDLHSSNGTRVNGKLIRQSALVPGDLIHLGQIVFRVCGPPVAKASLNRSFEHRPDAGTDVDVPCTSASDTPYLCAIAAAQERSLLGGVALDPVRDFIKQAAKVDATVLVFGETGTGKELVARAIHQQGPRARGPFVARNCGAFPESLFESELFGHEVGAFTGATKLHKGVFEQADGGTLLLDEIGEMPLAQQAKFLRVIEEQAVQRVGGHESVHVNVRVIVATNRDLAKAVAHGHFRRDLYYRLQVLMVRLPPLRGRPGDIEVLAKHFIGLQCTRWGHPVVELSGEALSKLEAHDWPGNVRELLNAIGRAVILCEGAPIEPDHIVFAQSPDVRNAGSVRLDDREREHILQVIASMGGNRTKAAAVLGINRSTLLRKLRRLRAESTEDH
jgi:DNA-binding NtrC family response regulator